MSDFEISSEFSRLMGFRRPSSFLGRRLIIPPILFINHLYKYPHFIRPKPNWELGRNKITIHTIGSIINITMIIIIIISPFISMRKLIRRGVEKIQQSLPFISSKASELQFKLLAPKGATTAKIGTRMQLPTNRYVNLEAYLQQFYNSTSQNGRANGQHLTFVVGADRSGKTSLIKQSLKEFKKRKASRSLAKDQEQIPFTTLSSPQYLEDLERQTTIDNEFQVVIQFDFSQKTMLKSEAFFHQIHGEIIKSILRIEKEVRGKTGETLLDAELIKQIVLSSNAIEYVFIFIKDAIFAILNNCDAICLSQQALAKLQQMNEVLVELSCHQFFMNSQPKSGDALNSSKKEEKNKTLFQQVLELIATDKGISTLEASIQLFLSAFKRMEYESRPAQWILRDYETGVQSTEYLFSILNYICGFGDLNKSTLATFISSNKNPYSKYYVGKGNHVDVVMAFMHLQNLSCFDNTKFVTWLDNMVIQLHNSSNLRTHFPVIIELPDCEMLTQLQNCGRMEVDNPTVMQIPGYFTTNMFRYTPGLVFNNSALKKLKPVLGRNPSTWNEAIQQLSKGTPMSQIVEGKAPFMLKYRYHFQSKINRLYLSPQLLPYIDDNTLKFHILELLGIIRKCKGFMKTLYLYQNVHVFSSPIFTELYSKKVVYQHYYNTAVNLVDMRDLLHIDSYIKNVSFYEKIWFRIWKYFKSPYIYFLKELRYRDDLEVEEEKRLGPINERPDYMLRQYYGETRDYRVSLHEEVYKQKYNI